MSDLPLQSATPARSGRYADYFFRIDARSLGLFRILLSLVLIGLWTFRWRWLSVMYTDSGVLPRSSLFELVSGAPYFRYTPLAWFGSELGIRCFFLAALASYVLLLVGYRTRLASVLAFLFFVCISHRNPYILIGADFVLGSMLFWTMLLPVGLRFSVDAVRKALRGNVSLLDRANGSSKDWDRRTIPAPVAPRSLAALFVIVHFAAIYFFTGVWKTGVTWWGEGTALYYVLHMEQSLYSAGALLAEAPLWLLKMLAYGTLIMEYTVPLAFLLPWGQPWLRRIMLLALAGFHIGIAVTIDAGVFSYAMLAVFPLLLLPADWEAMKRIFGRKQRRVTAYYDDYCGICTATCRALRVLDRFGSIAFIGNSFPENFRHQVSPELTQRTVVVVDEATGEQQTKAAGAAMLLRALPFPWPVTSVIALPGVVAISNVFYDLVARNRTRISGWLGMTTCSVPPPGAKPKSATPSSTTDGAGEGSASIASPPQPLEARTGRWASLVNNTLALAFMLSVVCGMYYRNVVPIMRWEVDPSQPVHRAGIFLMQGTYVTMAEQYWNMFAPDAPAVDTWWVADARLDDGRNIDLFNQGQPTNMMRQPRYFETPFTSVWGNYLRHTAALGLLMPRHMIPASANHDAAILRRDVLDYIVRQYEQAGGTPINSLDLNLMVRATTRPDEPANYIVATLRTCTYDSTYSDEKQRYLGPDRTMDARIFGPNGQLLAQGPLDPWNELRQTGRWVYNFEDGSEAEEGVLIDGVKQGQWTLWIREAETNRRLGYASGPMVDGLKDGEWVTRLEDRVVTEHYKADVLEGPHEARDLRGRLVSKGQYTAGQMTGQWEFVTDAGVGKVIGQFEDNKRNGLWSTYENGVLVREETYVDDLLEGPFQDWYPNGQLAATGQCTAGKRTGVWKEFHPDGSLKAEGPYENGKRHGEWTEWITGGISRTRTYDHGTRVDQE